MKTKTSKILETVDVIAGKSYHQGTFASISHKYPSDFSRMSKEISELRKKLVDMLADE